MKKHASLHRIAPALTGAIAALLILPACSRATPDGNSATPGVPAGSLEVVVAASPEKTVLLSELANEFNASQQEVSGKPVYVTIQKTSSGIGADLLTNDWPEGTEAGAEEGQRRPTVWSPSAGLWGPVVNERRLQIGKDSVTSDYEPTMLTPVVIAMPEPMAQALGYPTKPIGWADVVDLAQNPAGWGQFGHPEWGPFLLGKTNPNISTTGFNTTIAQAYAGAGKQSDLTLEDLARPEVIAFLDNVESTVVHYGDTTLTFLDNLYRADQRGSAMSYISAVAIEEKSLIDYNRGDPAGKAAPGEKTTPPRTRLVAVYPKEGTLWSDNPYFILDANWVTDAQRKGAERFRDYVIDREASQKRALEFGFRPANPNVAVGPPIDAKSGLDPLQPQTVLPVPAGPVALGILRSWDTTRKAARVLIVLDVSGSMGESAGPNTDTTKLDLAKRAAIGSLKFFGNRDEVGLWIFSTDLTAAQDWQELAPLEPIATNRQRLESLLAGLIPKHGTGLYDTTLAAVQKLTPKISHDRITAVLLLTDGHNEDRTNNDLNGLLAAIGGSGELRGDVRVFAVAYGADADVNALRAIAATTDGALYESKDPRDIERVLRNVVSNF